MNFGYENPTLLYKLIDSLGNYRFFSFIYKSYIKTLPINGNETILDFGSGSGAGSKHLAKILSKEGGKLFCVDISEYWMKVAKKRLSKFKNVKFLIGQLPDLNFKNKSFDIIYIFYALHDVEPNLRNGIVNEFAKILKDDGKIIIKEPQRKNDGMPISEIINLMTTNGLIEKESVKKKDSYAGIFLKNDLQ
jgi:ubiquinone/menaquinone biosynthesis C-methylase UbiE